MARAAPTPNVAKSAWSRRSSHGPACAEVVDTPDPAVAIVSPESVARTPSSCCSCEAAGDLSMGAAGAAGNLPPGGGGGGTGCTVGGVGDGLGVGDPDDMDDSAAKSESSSDETVCRSCMLPASDRAGLLGGVLRRRRRERPDDAEATRVPGSQGGGSARAGLRPPRDTSPPPPPPPSESPRDAAGAEACPAFAEASTAAASASLPLTAAVSPTPRAGEGATADPRGWCDMVTTTASGDPDVVDDVADGNRCRRTA